MYHQTDEENIVRHSSGALINTDRRALEKYRKEKDRIKRIDEVEKDIQSLKEDLTEIKSLLQLIAKGR